MRYASVVSVLLATSLTAACGMGGSGAASSGATAVETPGAKSNPAPPPLVGPVWRLASLEGRPALTGVAVTAVFTDKEGISGSAGCNRYQGSARVSADRVTVGALASTRMFCADTSDQEDAYLRALASAEVYRITGTDLVLGPAQGPPTLVFRAE